MDETLFYVFGIALVVSAVGRVGDRSALRELSPVASRARGDHRLLRGLVGATATFAVLNARDQQHEREAEEARRRPPSPPPAARRPPPTRRAVPRHRPSPAP